VRILGTGVNGFIGAALATAAHAEGHDVVGVDVSTRGRRRPPVVQAIRGDITSPATWWGALGRIDVVVHSAAVHRPDQIARRPVRSIEVNLSGTSLLLELAAASGVERFIHLSSAKVYGEPLAFPSSEDDLPNRWSPMD
jgi:nucleoside-diphosphate-sugar epimerase